MIIREICDTLDKNSQNYFTIKCIYYGNKLCHYEWNIPPGKISVMTVLNFLVHPSTIEYNVIICIIIAQKYNLIKNVFHGRV